MWGAVLGGLSSLVSTGAQMYSQVQSAQANAQATAIQAGAEASQQRLTGQIANLNSQTEAINSDAQADYYLKQAGGFQLQGRQERESRMLQLGQEKGNIQAQAAGSGIAVTSKMVTKATSDTVKSAYNDMLVSARNEQSNASAALKNSKIARVNAENSRTIGEWTQKAYDSIASDTEKYGTQMAKSQLKAGYNSAIATGISGVMGLFGG